MKKHWFIVVAVVISLFTVGLTVFASPTKLGGGSAGSDVTINGAIRPKGIW